MVSKKATQTDKIFTVDLTFKLLKIISGSKYIIGIKISFEHVDSLAKSLLFRTYHLWNSTTELILLHSVKSPEKISLIFLVTYLVEMGSSWNFPARASPSWESSEPIRAELGHFNFRAETELKPSWNFFEPQLRIYAFSTSIMIITNWLNQWLNQWLKPMTKTND